MSLSLRLLLLLPLLHLFVVLTPMKLKTQLAPLAASGAMVLVDADENPEDLKVEFHVSPAPAPTTREVVRLLPLDPPTLESIKLETDRPKPRV